MIKKKIICNIYFFHMGVSIYIWINIFKKKGISQQKIQKLKMTFINK